MGRRSEDTRAAFERAVAERARQRYVLRLYVSGASPKSTQAIGNLKKVCEERLAGRYELEVVDVYQQTDRAGADHVVATPTLVRRSPLPLRRLIGDLSNTALLL